MNYLKTSLQYYTLINLYFESVKKEILIKKIYQYLLLICK